MKTIWDRGILPVLILMLLISVTSNAQVKFGENKTTINAASLLELESSASPYKGVLFPRISLSTTTTWTLNSSGTAAMMIYNTNAGITSSNTSYPVIKGGIGMYYWDGTGWVGMTYPVGIANGQYWSLKGNSGTNGGINFLGTTDNHPLVFKVSGQLAGFIDSSTGNHNTFLGYQAGKSTTTGTSAVYMGFQAGLNNTTGDDNIFLGDNAGAANTTGSENIFLGYNTGLANTIGNANIMLGSEAGKANINGNNNLYIGLLSGTKSTTSDNFFAGNFAGGNNTSGTRNTFLGLNSGSVNTTGSNNYFVGYYAGFSNTTGSNNMAIGVHADVATGALTRAGAIGYNAVVSASNSLVLGGTGGDAVNVGIGTTAPQELFQVGDATTGPNSPVILLQTNSNASGLGGIVRFRETGYPGSNYGMDIRHSTGVSGSNNEGLYFDRILGGVNTNAMFIDESNGRLGVGTANPQQNVHISGTSATTAIGSTGANLVTPTVRIDGLNSTNNTVHQSGDTEPRPVYASRNGDLVLVEGDNTPITNDNFIPDASPYILNFPASGTGVQSAWATIYANNFTLSRRALVMFSYSVSIVVNDYNGVVVSDGYVRLMQTWINILNASTSAVIKAPVANASSTYTNTNGTGTSVNGFLYNNGFYTVELPAGTYTLQIGGDVYAGGGRGVQVIYGSGSLDEVQVVAHYK